MFYSTSHRATAKSSRTADVQIQTIIIKKLIIKYVYNYMLHITKYLELNLYLEKNHKYL